MPPRADEPPRRGPQPRRGASREQPTDGREADPGFTGIGDARAYTPRGRTVRESDQRTRSPRTGRTTDPFRPALQVLDDGQPAPRRRGDDGPARRQREPGDDDAAGRSQHDDDDAGRRPQRGDDAAARRPQRGDGTARRPQRDDGAVRRTPRDRGDDDAARRPRRDHDDDAARRPRRDHDDDGARRPRRDRDDDAVRRRGVDGGAPRTPRDRAAEAAPRSANGRTSKTRSTAGGERQRATARRTGGNDRERAVAPEPRRTARGRPANAARYAPKRPVPAAPPEPPKLANSTRRLRLGTVLALTLFVTIGVRLVTMQVMESPADARRLLEQRNNRLAEVVLPAPRGSILDRSGAVLAHSVEARYIYADPELVKNPADAAARLSPLLGIAPSKLQQLMARKKSPFGGWSRFQYLARGVDIAVADRIDAMKLPGISSDRDERRDVPGADLAANLIGFTGEDHTGLEGLEARYDELLRGTDGERVYERGNPRVDSGQLAKEIPGGYHHETPAQPGTSLQLTIDRDLQFEVQRFLSDDMRRVSATIGAAVVLDVQTGEVLAQASYPAYNAAKPFDAKPADRDDVASSVVADPGSTHKAFTLAAALQEGAITPQSAITVGPALMRGGARFPDTHPQPRGTKLTVPGVLAYSSNVGTILIADRLGKQKLYEYQQKFGLGKATGEGTPGEASGRLLAPEQWSGSASGSVPIGMSVDATLIQMAAGYATIANDGLYVQPHLIKDTISGTTGAVTPAEAPQTRRVLSPEVARQMRTMMEAVVDVKGATGTRAAIDGYRVAGKTGTGKMLVEGRYTSHNAGSFIGMAPADNPRFVIGVFADVANGTGGEVAAPAFQKMMSFALAHYRVPPSGSKAPKFKIYP
ncbi:penicillin-binding transpeptidase domain-containing protein [Krasilnikovia sp. MM14-A1004]|uniref:penicillin-binding transpeptidase domain-containing protein n=1 Tax=Krasilnikovia sp. MM14-A1004 TaxID=3373541 RepID=UPI00399C7B31